MIYDILIWPGSQDEQPDNSPRCIKDNEYQIEWGRDGLRFVKCPKGKMSRTDVQGQSFAIETSTVIPWYQLEKYKYYDITTENGEKRYCARVWWWSSVKDWLENCERFEENVNTEVMWKIAEIFEEKWDARITIKEVADICTWLEALFRGIDGTLDTLREKILGTWYQRLETRLTQDLLCPSEYSANETFEQFKRFIIRNVDNRQHLGHNN